MITEARSLLGKELQQHTGLFFWLAGFCAVVTWLLFRISIAGGQTLSYLSITSIFAVPGLLVLAFIMGQRLVAVEYYGQTQRFIEALPIPRGYVQWVKYLLGFFYLLVLLGGVWMACMLEAARFEVLTPEFVGFMALRLSAFVFAVWSMVFTFSLLGKLRIPLIASAVLALSLINSFTSFEMGRFGPLALMDQQLFAFERKSLPTQALIETITGGAAMLALGMWLARMRDGSLVESLATPVSSRAKGFLISLAVAALGIYTYFGPEPEVEPFSFSDTLVVVDGPVAIAYLDPQFEADAVTLMSYLSERLRSLETIAPTLGDDFPVQVSLAPVADPTEFDTQLTSDEGVAVSANFSASAGWDNPLFGAFVVHQILYANSAGRLLLEPHHWLLDGFSRWWAAHGETSTSAIGAQVDPILLEALHVSRNTSISEEVLRRWDISSDKFGEIMAMSVGYSGWEVLQEHQGTEAALELARQEFSRPSYGDVRDWWMDWRDPLSQRFERATGWAWEDFLTTWEQRLKELRLQEDYRRELDAIATGKLTITPEVTNGVRSLRYVLTLNQSLPANSRCAALHTRLPSFDVPVGRAMLREVELLWPEASGSQSALSMEYLLSGEYGQGARVFAAFECQFPQFPAPLYLGSIRLTMP